MTCLGGRVLVIDQIAPADPLAAIELDRFERARDASHTRLLSDADLAGNFDMNSLDLRAQGGLPRDPSGLDPYLNLAGCHGEARTQAQELAPAGYAAERSAGTSASSERSAAGDQGPAMRARAGVRARP